MSGGAQVRAGDEAVARGKRVIAVEAAAKRDERARPAAGAGALSGQRNDPCLMTSPALARAPPRRICDEGASIMRIETPGRDEQPGVSRSSIASPARRKFEKSGFQIGPPGVSRQRWESSCPRYPHPRHRALIDGEAVVLRDDGGAT
jgi:hypothetical protein